jgi:hypothetical protein
MFRKENTMITAIAGILSIIGLVVIFAVTINLICDAYVRRADRRRQTVRRLHSGPKWEKR